MTNTIQLLQKIKNALNGAMAGGRYNIPAETEQGFIQLLDESLKDTMLAPYLNDINCIIIQYMALADELDLIKLGEQNNVKQIS